MANIVAGFGVPHTPVFPFFVKRDGPECETAKLFAAQKEHLAAVRPDVIVMFDTDHLNTFFLDNLPIFAVGVDKSFTGPTTSRGKCRSTKSRRRSIWRRTSATPAIEAGFDAALTQHYSVDHSIAVPLHFLTPRMQVPVVPFFISGHLPPLPSAQRCYALGQAVAPRDRHHGRRRCGSWSWARAASRSKSRARAWRPAAPTACPIRIGPGASSS